MVNVVLPKPLFERSGYNLMDDLDAAEGDVWLLDEARTSQQVATLNEIARKLRELSEFLDCLATTPLSPRNPLPQ
jgi:hypothetical protein